MPRGGARQGTPGGGPYPNRSDLTQPKVAIETAPDQTYGMRAQQAAAQRAVPVAAPPGTLAPGGAPAPPTPAGAPPARPVPPDVGSLPGLAAGAPEPGELGWTGPTQRPNEPLMTGSATGAGPGPEALTGIGAIAARQAPQDTATKLLATLASQPTAGTQLRDLARQAMATGR